ncbi:MAG: hypothetical protein GY758_23855 [Fuerstiella sp.]|nr:hypothetical protein [Fuerstiella sp.]
MLRQDKCHRDRNDIPSACTMLTAVLFMAGGLIPLSRVQSEELSVSLRVSPRVEKGRINPYIFGAGIDHKTNPLRTPRYPEKVLKDIEDSGLRIARYPGGFVFNRNDHPYGDLHSRHR